MKRKKEERTKTKQQSFFNVRTTRVEFMLIFMVFMCIAFYANVHNVRIEKYKKSKTKQSKMRREEKDIGNDVDDDRKWFGIMKSFENFNESKSNSLSFSWVLSLCFDPSGHFDHCAAFLLCFRCCT